MLGEFFVNARRKAQRPLSLEETVAFLTEIATRPCIAIDEAIVWSVIERAERFGISYWDGAIIAAAERLAAPVLYTEDLDHGQLYGSVRVLNPFRPK